jgi:hypothetical protein
MNKNKVPKVIKDTFYLNWSNPKLALLSPANKGRLPASGMGA